MAVRMTLREFLDRVEGIYKSIDLRVVAVRTNDTWQNALTVVRFSYKEVKELEEQLQELEAKWGEVQTENFRIQLQAVIFDALQFLCEQFNEGKLFFFRDGDVQFGRSIDLLSVEGIFRDYDYGYAKGEADPYPFLEAFVGEHSPLLKDERLQSEVKSQTLCDLYPLVRDLLEVNFSRDTPFDFVVAAPFYARIEHRDFGEQSCKIRIKFHKDIKALAVTAIVRRGDRDDTPLRDKARCTISLEQSEELGEYMRLWTRETELLNATPADYLWVDLIQAKPTALDIEKSSFPMQISRFLESKKPAKNPLLAAFRQFCNLDELEEYLTKPTQAKPFKKGRGDPDGTFEQGVVWLLGLCGFDTVWLGQTKHEVMKEERTTRFGVDILAYNKVEKTVVLVGCTIGVPKSEDVDNLKSVRKVLLDEVFKDVQIAVKPLVFSAAPELGNKEREGVKLFDASDIRCILNYVRQGEIARALSDYFGFPFRP